MKSFRSLFVASLGALSSLVAAPAAPKPNIVILYADDMGYGDIAVQNPDSKIPTPNLDRLAREGLRFTDAHSSSGVCTPSRYALLTGRYHWRQFHAIVNSFEPSVFEPGRLTLPEMLRTAGYRTACIGKWHLGWEWNAIKRPGATPDPKTGYAPDAFDWSKPIPGGPLAHGFDYYFGDDVPNFPPYTWFENDRVLTAPNAPLTITPQTAEGNWEARPGPMVEGWDFYAVMPRLTEKAVAYIDQQKGGNRPFFLYLPFTSPHAPIVPAREFQGKSQAGGYGDYVVQTDATVGRVLAALEKNGLRENTIVIFSADNGPEHYAYARIKNFNHRSTGPLRGVKRDIWEGGHRVPFIVRWPGVTQPNQVTDGLMSQIDLLATLAAAIGQDLPATVAEDGFNQLTLWRGGASSRSSHVHNTNKNHYAMRAGNWVLIDAPSGNVTKVPPGFDAANGYVKNPHPGELYDLSQDLSERHNLFAEKPEKVAELKALLTRLREQGFSAPGKTGRASGGE
ncbi:MAG: arylsulfatase [Verrucomicrobia bacterium]|nr:arylsulfatase [Verrucomicrobiota bacterium]